MKRPDAVRGPRGVALAAAAFALGIPACAKPPVADVYPQVAEYDGRVIAELSFENTDPFSPDSLEALTETEASGCSLLGIFPFCLPGTDIGRETHRLDLRTVGGDLTRLAALYRQDGYFGTRVVPEIDEVEEEEEGRAPIRVQYVVRRGDPITLDSLVIEGTEGIADPDSLEALLPLQQGERLDLGEFLASADTVTEVLRMRGHAYAEVLRNFAVDTVRDRATVWLLAVPGPRVVVDTVRVSGIQELGRNDVMRQLTFGSGDLLRLRDLQASQRNLYDLDLVRFASVSVAPDSLQQSPLDSTTATVRVVLTEAPEHVVEGEARFGTVECFGVRARWSDRSVFGGGRQVALTGSVSRIGIGAPLDGLQSGLCEGGYDPEFGDELDYRLAAEFTQPYFLSPRNQLVATAYTEHQSEPDYFKREAWGGQFRLAHRFDPRQYLSSAVEVEYRETTALPALYCFEFRACSDEDVEELAGAQWQNALVASWVRDRGNSPVNPTSGYLLRSTASWSTPLLGSDYDFLRADAEAAVYRPLGNGWVLAGFARVGSFITRATLGRRDFIPPEERFFAGGASSVRGYDRYALGPGLYIVQNDTTPAAIDTTDPGPVDFIATGGTAVSVLSVETRFPSPVLRDLLRLAVFVDAGTVSTEPIWKLGSQWRATPGAGLRIQTPVGPARVDIGYNPYPRPTARLYATDPETGDLVRIADAFEGGDRGFWDRLTLHIAVGQAF